ncbi:MAG: TolC family protein [Bacteroidota bacterium]
MNRLILLFLFLSHMAAGQEVDYDRIVPSGDALNLGVEETLIRLAWQNHPDNEILRRNISIAEKEIKLQKRSWWDGFNITGNVNDLILSSDSLIAERAQFFPIYNFSGRLSIGTFVTLPLNTKIAKEKYKIAESNLNAKKLNVRAEVLKLYEQYKLARELLGIQNEILEDAQSNYSLYESKFRDGDTTFEEYRLAQVNLNQVKIERAKAQAAFEVAKINLEEMIGVPLEEVIAN